MGGTASGAVVGNVVQIEREGSIATLRLNRPECLNALNVELSQALLAALRRANEDKDVRAVILTGAGRGFCAGGDLALLREMRERGDATALNAILQAGKEIVLLMASMHVPVIAAVNGPAAGGGMNLALACDLRIASEDASLGQSFAKIGLFPDWGGTHLLPRLVGPSKAAELFYTAEMIPAAEAFRLGLVNQVVPGARLAEDSRIVAGRLAAAPLGVVRAIRETVFGSNRAALERALDLENQIQKKCFEAKDSAEGLRAFFEKRKPKFQGM